MTQFCALTDTDITRVIQDKLKVAGGISNLKATSVSEDGLLNFDKFNQFIEEVVESIQPGTTPLKAIERLKVYANLVIGNNSNIVASEYLSEKVNSFWSSAPKIIDNSTNAVNSANPNVTDNSDNRQGVKALGIDRYFANINHISEFIDNFRNNVNEKIFMYTNSRGKVVEVTSDNQLNEAVKLLKNLIAQDLVTYLQSRGVENLDPEIYNPDTFVFNETVYDNLIKSAIRTIKSDNWFLNETNDTRYAFSNLEMLRNFDKYVDLYLRDSISITKGYENSNHEPSNGVKYKKSNSMHVDKHYGSETDSDMYNHTNESMRIFIESIPYFDRFSRTNKRLSMNMFNSVFSKLNETFPDAMAEMRISPEEKFMEILQSAMDDTTRALGDRVYLTSQLEGIYNKMRDLYNLLKNSRFGNGLYSIIANYVNKSTSINYNQLVWDKLNKRYKLEKLSNKASTRLSSDLEKGFLTSSKYADYNLASRGVWSPINATYTITTESAVYTIPFNGEDMSITIDEDVLTSPQEVFDFVMNQDPEFRELMTTVFANKVDEEVMSIAFNSYNNNFMKIFNLMGNIILNNEFAKGTRANSGINRVSLNNDYFMTDEVGSRYGDFVRGLVDAESTGDKRDINKRIFNPTLGTLRVAGFNKGDIGRNVIYNAIADSNGDSVRSYVVGESGNMLSLTRLPNVINADRVLFRQLSQDSQNPFLENNIFSDLFNIAADTLLKTTVTNRDGTVAAANSLSVSDLITSLIMSDYFGDPETIYVQPVTYADKSQVWLKGISRNKPFEYQEMTFPKGLGGATVNSILNLHFRTMQATVNSMQDRIVNDYNTLYSYLLPGTVVNSYEEATRVLSENNFGMNDIYEGVRRALNDGIKLEIYPEIHFSNSKQGLIGNETLQRTIDMFNDFSQFRKNQQDEKKLWAYIASKEGVAIEYTFANGKPNEIINAFANNHEDYRKNWVNDATGELILFKVKNAKGEYINTFKLDGVDYDVSHYSALDAIKFNFNYTVELNPEIDKFFEINGLVTNNYLAATVGMPFIHPAKTSFDEQVAKLRSNKTPSDQLTEAAIRRMEAIRTSAHSKRMVIYGATIHPFIQQKFDGIPDNYNIACVSDKITTVFNLQGGREKQKQYDGGVWENPFIAIWEKNALPELALSPIHRKSIMFMPNSRYMASGLGKWATFAFNNEMIRNASSRNTIAVSGHDFMRKMTDHKWIIPNLDITNNGNIDYSGQYYYDENLHLNIRIRSILKAGITVNPDGTVDNSYNIVREVVNNDGTLNENFTKMYQDQLNTTDIINSNYDLWVLLGGEYSKSLTNNGIETFLDWSEASVDKVARVASEVTVRRSLQDDGFDIGYESYLSEIRDQDENLYNTLLNRLTATFEPNTDRVSYVTQSFYLQPMKHSDIHYVAPESSIKNGAANINPVRAYNETGFMLNSWSVPSLHLGIQLNADHHVDNSEISEMSQVISAMSEMGTTQHIANAAYKAIGQSVANNLKELNIHINSDNTEGNNQIYYILGKELCRSFAGGSGWEDISLANAYLSLVLKEFGTNYAFYQDKDDIKFKLPFDDPNIFDAFYNSFASGKNREAIKRRFPGLQAVLTPSQDFNTLYDVDGKIVKYEDLLADETKRGPNGERLYANARERLTSLDRMVDAHEIEAGDFVEINGDAYMVQGYTGGPSNNVVGLSYVRNMRGQQIKKLYSQGRNLKNANHKFTISEADGANIIGGFRNFDIWDFDSAKLSHNLGRLIPWLKRNADGLYLDRDNVLFSESNGIPVQEITELYAIYDEVRQRSIGKWKHDFFNGNIDNDLKYINDIILTDLDMLDGRTQSGNREFVIPFNLRANPNVKTATIETIEYLPYEVMIGATQASAFGLKPGDSIQEIMERKESFFYDRFSENQKTLAKLYDAYLVHPNGNHLHVLLDSSAVQSKLNSMNAVEMEIETEVEGETLYRVIDGKRVYTVNENTKWYQVPLGNNLTYEFVVVKSASEVKGILASGIYDRIINNINLTAVDIVVNAANTGLNAKELLVLSLMKMNPNLTQDQRRELKAIETPEQYLDYIVSQNDLEILMNNARKRYQSFLQYLDFIVARIPAQSMQSFMNMRLVGFVNTPTNIALVPSTQFWLQGSDLDIDKAFMLGATISESGYYVDWSDALFNYSSKETVDASNNLPIPDGLNRTLNENIEYGYGLSSENEPYNVLIDAYNNPINISNLMDLTLDNYLEASASNPQKIRDLAQLIDRILTTKVTALNLPENIIELVNSHSAIELDKFRINEALKNKIWYLLRETGESIRNYYAQMNPISLDAAQIAAGNSEEGKDSNIISLMNPATVMQLQLANSVGKDCIGISATGSKVASAIIQHFNEVARLVNAGNLPNESLTIPQVKYTIDGNENAMVSKPTFTNINWTSNSNIMNNPDPQNVYNRMLELGINDDILNSISVLISISTDNAKELILQKIGATKDLMSVYVYGLLIGQEFSDIADFMTKPEVSMVQRKSSRSILNESKKNMNLSRAVLYYLDGVDPNLFDLTTYLGGIDDVYKTNFELTSDNAKKIILKYAEDIVSAREDLKNRSPETIPFNELLGGQVKDKYVLNLQKELINELIYQAQNNDITFKEKSRESQRGNSQYGDYIDESVDMQEELSDFINEQGFDEEYGQPKSRNKGHNSMMYIRYLNEAKNRINDLLQFSNLNYVYENIETLDKLKTDSESITTLGRFLSINQGIPTKQVDRINKISGIENNIRKKLGVTEGQGSFNMIEFFTNKELQDFWISEYGKLGEPFNILSIVANSPHFSEMWRGFITVQEASDRVAIKSWLTNKLAKHLLNRGILNTLTQKDVGKIKSFISDLFVNKFLSIGLNNKTLNIPMNMTMVYEDTGKLVPLNYGDKTELDLSNTYDRLSFKHWFETEYLPEMRNLHPQNSFLKALDITTYSDDMGNPETVTRLPINMMSNREADKAALTNYTNGFIEIKNIKEKMKGEYIGNEDYQYTNEEVFFLYNLLVNKNKFGEASLTKIFDSSIWEYRNNENKLDNLIIDYFNFERGLVDDPNLKFNEREDMSIDDLELRFAAKNKKPGQYYFEFIKGLENVRQYYDKNGDKFEVTQSALQLPVLLKTAQYRGASTIKNISDKIKELIYNNKAEIKFVDCHG